MNEIPEEDAASKSRRRNFAFISGAIAGVVTLLIALCVFLYIDPFGWNFLGLRRAEAAAEAIPLDAALYLSLDLGNITCEALNPIVWAFSEEWEGEGKCAVDELIKEVDESMAEAWGLTFSDDVRPWIGESIALGWSDFVMDSYGSVKDVEMVIAVEVRKPDAADEFLLALLEAISEETGEQIIEADYQNETISYVDTVTDLEQYAFSRSGNMLLFSLGKGNIEAAIDAQEGESLADSTAFQDTLAKLPSGRMLTVYLDSSQIIGAFSGILNSLGQRDAFEVLAEAFGPAHYEAGGLYVVDDGIRADMAFVFDPETLTEEMLTAYEYVGKQPQTDSLLPEDTLVYRVGSGIHRSVDGLQENLRRMEGAGELTAPLLFFEMTYGFHPIADFLAKLDGEWAFGILPSSRGIWAEELDFPMGFVFLAGTSDPTRLLDVSESIASLLEEYEVGHVKEVFNEKTTLYELVDMIDGDTVLFTYGVGEGYFLVGSTAHTLNELFTGGRSLADSERYIQVWEAFPKGMTPVMYVDVQGLTTFIQQNLPANLQPPFEGDAEQYLHPVTTFAVAGSPIEDGVSKAALILFIETE
jgi:hypothetical protein